MGVGHPEARLRAQLLDRDVRARRRPSRDARLGIVGRPDLIFSTSPESRKGRNLARDPRVAVGIEYDDDVVVLEGAIQDIELDTRIVDLYAAKYDYRPQPSSAVEAWYRLRPKVAYAWDRNYPRTATPFSFD